jgi:hypothetical protein
MKDPKSQKHPTTHLKKNTIGKRWKMVKPSTHPNNHQAFIMTKMIQYQFVLQAVRQLDFFKDQPYFDRDYKDDGNEPFLIHCFVSETFYWRIECNLLFEIIIEYSFENCPVEGMVWAAIAWQRLHNYAKPVKKQPSLAEFHKNVLACQERQYINGFK